MAADAQAEADAGDRLLASRSPDESAAFVDAFKQGLGETGYVEGINIAVDYRWAEGDYDRLPELAADLVRRKVDVIMVAGGPPTALAAKDATSTIPIVFVIGTDPVELHLVASLARPGGNVTGVSIMFVELTSKRLELRNWFLRPHPCHAAECVRRAASAIVTLGAPAIIALEQ